MTESEYQKEIEKIFTKFPSFQIVGGVAYKPGLDNMFDIDQELGFPSKKFRSVHVAGTNGKGSVSHMIASALMQLPASAGVSGSSLSLAGDTLKIGLYTSPHLVDFRERIKVNGEMVPKEFVYDFLKRFTPFFEEKNASFFEITTAMAFDYFAKSNVDIAVIECGLGGRLDSTNIITPMLSIITSIGLDHCQYLGNTLKEIAGEKAGIIKRNIPVVIGESGTPDSGVKEVFMQVAKDNNSKIYFAENTSKYVSGSNDNKAEGPRPEGACLSARSASNHKISRRFVAGNNADVQGHGSVNLAGNNADVQAHGSVNILSSCILSAIETLDLKGDCQNKNIKTVAVSLSLILKQFADEKKLEIDDALLAKVIYGIENAAKLTGLRGRWEQLGDNPLIICDIGHNEHAFRMLGKQISRTAEQRFAKLGGGKLIMVFGIMRDKDLEAEKEYLPQNAIYVFVNANSPRALPANELKEKMLSMGFKGECAGSIKDGIAKAKQISAKEDFIFIGGSSYVVAEALENFK
jgi:dihydrofolate synthase/folylpolyglutamate synthase